MNIKKIPLHVQTLMSASACINNYKRAVEELVYNSLDAESTSIAVRINVEESFIQILDNGSGIEKSNLTLLGTKYATSKFVNITTLKSAPNKYGFRGLSLSSIIEISHTVKISSRVDNSNETWIKSFYKGKEKNITLHTNRPSKGTTEAENGLSCTRFSLPAQIDVSILEAKKIEVIGFLYNLKIQKKSIESIKELQSIKLYLQQLSLVHCNVSISLRDDCKNEIVFTMNKNRDIHQTLRSFFNIQQYDVHDLQVEKNQYKVRGFIGKNKEGTKIYQWIYINGRIINNSAIHKKINMILHKMINITYCGNKKNKNIPTDENSLFNNSFPHYFIFITCPSLDFDIIYKNHETIVEFHNWPEIEKLLEKLIKLYSGDLSIKFQNKEETNVQHNKNCDDTRKKVKEIMEKILNNNAYKTKISQFKKGVKGKIVKRKKESKIKLQDIKTKQKAISKINLPKRTVDLTKIIDKKNNITPPYKENSFKESNMKNKHLNVKSNKRSGYKALKNNRPPSLHNAKNIIINKQRESLYEQKIKELNYKKYKKLQNYKNKSYEKDFLQRREYICKDSIKQDDIVEKKYICLNKVKVKTSYDLLNPVEFFQSFEPSKKHQHIFIHQQTLESYVATCETYFPPITTFDSHNYNKEIEQKKNVMKQFISSDSCRNFLLHKNCIFERQGMYKTKDFGKDKDSSSKKILNQYESILPYINESMKTNKNSTMCDINETSNIKSIDFEEKQHISQNVNDKKNCYSIGINYENTYTIDILSSSLFTRNSDFNETNTLQNQNNLSIRNKSIHSLKMFTQNEAFNSNVKNNVNNNNIISESQTLEPLNYCETVFQTDKWSDIEKEFNTSFLHKNNIEGMDQWNPTNEAFVKEELVNNCELNELNENNKIVIDSSMFDQVVTEIGKDLNDTQTDKQNIISEEKKESNSIAVEHNNINNFELKSRHNFVPKGMSQIFNNNYKIPCAVDSAQEYYEDDVYKKFADDVLNNIKVFEPEIENVKDVVSKDLKKVNNRLNKDNADLIFDCSSLETAEVLGQVDTKFILAIIKGRIFASGNSSNFLALFDQHAVDERIRLESNINDYLNGDQWTSVSIDSVIKIKLSREDCFYVYNHKEKFYRFGLQWTFENSEILIHAIPTAILGKNIREVELVIRAVKNLISELIDVIKTLRGNVASYPKSIMNLICSEACRYAIKFGDKLSKTHCSHLINALSKCKTPFQCAHGRPVMAILMELRDNETSYTVNLNKIKGFKTMTTLQDKNKHKIIK